MSDRILPKSLHTVTVLVNLAAHIRAGRFVETTAVEDVRYALRILGLSDLTDAHGLFAAAVKRVEADRKAAAAAAAKSEEARRDEARYFNAVAGV